MRGNIRPPMPIHALLVANRDIVVWYGTSFHHLPRNEDEPHMHAHWSGFTIAPRDLTAQNILPPGP